MRGTLIRIWSARTGEGLAEFRRGTQPAEIFDLKFDIESKFLTVCSNTGTIHIFAVGHLSSHEETVSQQAAGGNVKSSFSFLGGLASIAGSEWSFANFKLDTSLIPDRGMCA